MMARTRLHYAGAWLPRRCYRTTLAILLLLAGYAHGQSNDESLHLQQQQRVASLEAEVYSLRQQVAQLHGAAVAGTSLSGVHAPVLQPFVPSTANLQRTLATRAATWPAYWSFLSAVSADNKVTASHVMTDRPGGSGSAAFMVLGDAAGRLYFFTPAGHLLYEHNTGVATAVTAMTSQLLRSNTSQLAVGLQQGTVLLLEVGHESFRSLDGSGIAFVTAIMSSEAVDRERQSNGTVPGSHVQSIRHLLFTKSNKQRKLLLVLDASGQVVLLMPPSGKVMLTRHLEAPPLAVNLNTDYQMVIQTPATAFVVLTHRGRSRIARPCAGLAQTYSTGNNTSSAASADQGINNAGNSHNSTSNSYQDQPDVLVTAVFDPLKSFRVFGVTRGGELVAMTVPSSQRTSSCRVVQRIPLGLPPGPVRLLASKNRLILLHAAGVATFNTSQPLKLSQSHMVSHTWPDVWQLYGLGMCHTQQYDVKQHVAGVESATPHGIDHQEDSREVQECDTTLLHTDAYDQETLSGAAHGNLVLLPLGEKGISAFAPAEGLGRFASGGGFASSGTDSGLGFDWVRFLQPFVVIMMVVVGVWQFVRASNKHRVGQQSMRGMGAGFSSGLEGLGPEDLGQMGMGFGRDSFGGGLDRNLGRYSGPRSNRSREDREREAMFDPYGGLGALGAKRRARQVMHHKGMGGSSGGGFGAVQLGGASSHRGNAGAGARAAHSNRAGILRRSDPGVVATEARRVRFSKEDAAEEDDIVDTPMHEDLMSGMHEEEFGTQPMDTVDEDVAAPMTEGNGWAGGSEADVLLQQMAAVGISEDKDS